MTLGLSRRFFMAPSAAGETGAGGTSVSDVELLEATKADQESKTDEIKAKSGDEPEPKKAKESKLTEKLESVSSELKSYKAELEKYKAKEKAELDKQKTQEQLLAEREAEIAKLQRTNLIERIRRENGFTEQVFNVVAPEGNTEEEIKASFEAYKASLDEYLKINGQKSAQGADVTTSKPDMKKAEEDGLTYLEKFFKQQKKATG